MVDVLVGDKLKLFFPLNSASTRGRRNAFFSGNISFRNSRLGPSQKAFIGVWNFHKEYEGIWKRGKLHRNIHQENCSSFKRWTALFCQLLIRTQHWCGKLGCLFLGTRQKQLELFFLLAATNDRGGPCLCAWSFPNHPRMEKKLNELKPWFQREVAPASLGNDVSRSMLEWLPYLYVKIPSVDSRKVTQGEPK